MPPPFDWDELATEIAYASPTLADVHALLRTHDRDLGWDYNPKTAVTRCYQEKRTIAQWISAANTFHLHERQPGQAATNLTALMDLAAWHAEDFTLVGQMLRVGIGSMALQSTWATLQSPGLTDAQLADLQRRLESLSVLTNFPRTIEHERAGVEQVFLGLRSGEETMQSAFGHGSTGWDGAMERAASLVWRGFSSDADELFFLRHMQGEIEASRKLARTRDWSGVKGDLAVNLTGLAKLETWQGQLMLLSRYTIPNFSRAFQTAVRYETRRELTIAAIALKRHRRKHGTHPTTLNQIVPEFLLAMPVDWMDGKPLRYRLNADGTYTLWSVNEDFKDDGGDAMDASTTSRQRDIWDGRDAVWPRVPKLP